MKRVLFLAVPAGALFLTACGDKKDVSGRVVASAVQGMAVCDEDLNECSITDADGRFSVSIPKNSDRVLLALKRDGGGYYVLGSVAVAEGQENVITPQKFMDGNGTEAGVYRSLIHALFNDVNGTADTVNLFNVKVVRVEDGDGNDLSDTAFKEALRSVVERGGVLKLDFLDPNGDEKLIKVNGTEGVDLCDAAETSCQKVDLKAYDWLVLIYIAGDNNLSDYADRDINEMSQVNYSPTVKVVALVDHSGNTGGEIYESNSDGGFSKTADIPEPNTGDPQTVIDFVREYTDRYPADKIGLIFWDHGYAWKSLTTPQKPHKLAGIDETDNDDVLWMYEVRDALQNLKDNGIELSFVGFDECLMGNVEVFYDVSINAEAVAASEALEPGTGWDYSLVLGKLNANPKMSAYDFAKAVVDSYKEAYENDYCSNNRCTMLAAKVEEINSLVNATDEIARYYLDNGNDTDTDSAYTSARSLSEEIDIGGQLDPNLIDLYTFADNLRGNVNSTAPDRAVNIIDNLYKYSNDPNYHGVSIFFPEGNNTLGNDDAYFCGDIKTCVNYSNPFTETQWDNFIYQYIQKH